MFSGREAWLYSAVRDSQRLWKSLASQQGSRCLVSRDDLDEFFGPIILHHGLQHSGSPHPKTGPKDLEFALHRPANGVKRNMLRADFSSLHSFLRQGWLTGEILDDALHWFSSRINHPDSQKIFHAPSTTYTLELYTLRHRPEFSVEEADKEFATLRAIIRAPSPPSYLVLIFNTHQNHWEAAIVDIAQRIVYEGNSLTHSWVPNPASHTIKDAVKRLFIGIVPLSEWSRKPLEIAYQGQDGGSCGLCAFNAIERFASRVTRGVPIPLWTYDLRIEYRQHWLKIYLVNHIDAERARKAIADEAEVCFDCSIAYVVHTHDMPIYRTTARQSTSLYNLSPCSRSSYPQQKVRDRAPQSLDGSSLPLHFPVGFQRRHQTQMKTMQKLKHQRLVHVPALPHNWTPAEQVAQAALRVYGSNPLSGESRHPNNLNRLMLICASTPGRPARLTLKSMSVLRGIHSNKVVYVTNKVRPSFVFFSARC